MQWHNKVGGKLAHSAVAYRIQQPQLGICCGAVLRYCRILLAAAVADDMIAGVAM
jgi:hypothetical protein